MSADKYSSIFLHQMEAIVYLLDNLGNVHHLHEISSINIWLVNFFFHMAASKNCTVIFLTDYQKRFHLGLQKRYLWQPKAQTYLLLVCVFPNCSSRLSYQSLSSFLACSRHSCISDFSSLSILSRRAAFSSLHFLQKRCRYAGKQQNGFCGSWFN